MRKNLFLLSLAAFLITASAFAQQRAKYVFYFIGDGMGVNQVNGTETFYAALEGRIRGGIIGCDLIVSRTAVS